MPEESGDRSPISKTMRYLTSSRGHLAIILLFSMTILFSGLGGHGLANYDDCFYAQKAKEILRTGEWMTMHYNHQPAWENSPFFMWLIALSYSVFGVTEFAAKFPSALFGVATILLVYYFARSLYNESAGFLSASVLATTFLFTRYARRAMMDVTLSFFVTLAMFAIILALRKDARWFFVWALATSVAILMKSVLGMFPLVVGFSYIVLTKRYRVIVSPVFVGSCLLLVAAGGSWYADQTLKFGSQFLDAHFGWLILYRGITMEPQPWYEHLSYLEDIVTYYWPWVPVLVAGLWLNGRKAFRDESALLLVVWVMAYVVTMSAMKSRVVWYIMPIFPACAMIVGSTLDVWLNERRKRYWTIALSVLTVVSAIVLNLTPLTAESEREGGIRGIAPIVRKIGLEGGDIVGFREDYYGLNNALLFYSDFAGYPIYENYDSLASKMGAGRSVICILEREELAGVTKNVPGIKIIAESEEKVLVANRELNTGGPAK